MHNHIFAFHARDIRAFRLDMLNMRMVSIFEAKLGTSFLNMVYASEEHVHFFQRNISSFWHDEDDEDGEETIYTAKEEECVARRGDVSYAYKEKRKQRGERKLTNCTWPRKRGKID